MKQGSSDQFQQRVFAFIKRRMAKDEKAGGEEVKYSNYK